MPRTKITKNKKFRKPDNIYMDNREWFKLDINESDIPDLLQLGLSHPNSLVLYFCLLDELIKVFRQTGKLRIIFSEEKGMKLLGWGKDKYRNAKRLLVSLGVITSYPRKDKNGRVKYWMIYFSRINTTRLVNHTPGKPGSNIYTSYIYPKEYCRSQKTSSTTHSSSDNSILESNKKSPYSFKEKHSILSKKILKANKSNYPDEKKIPKVISKNVKILSNELRKLEKLDKYDFKKEIIPLFKYAANNPDWFWSEWLVFPSQIRYKKPKESLTRFDKAFKDYIKKNPVTKNPFDKSFWEKVQTFIHIASNKEEKATIDGIISIKAFYNTIPKGIRTATGHHFANRFPSYKAIVLGYLKHLKQVEISWLKEITPGIINSNNKLFVKYIRIIEEETTTVIMKRIN